MTLQALRHRTPRTHPCKNQPRKDGPPPISLLRDEVQKWYPLTVSAPSRENAERKKKGVPPAAQKTIAKAMRRLGARVSAKEVGRVASKFVKSGPVVSIGYALYGGYEEYKACMNN
jgi:hypothetical protein